MPLRQLRGWRGRDSPKRSARRQTASPSGSFKSGRKAAVPKRYLDHDVLTAAQKRVAWTFDNFPKVYVSFSAGKDSSVMVHLVADEARRRRRRFGLLLVD